MAKIWRAHRVRWAWALMVAAGAMGATAAPAATAPAATAIVTATTRLDGAALVADVDVLEHAYEALHPGLYRYATPRQVDARLDALRDALRGGATLADAYLAFSRFAATVRCGHTHANFYNQPKAIRAALFDATPRVPFHFRWLDGRMIVARSLRDDGALAPGDEIVAIDGVPARTLLATMMPLARADGGNDAKRVDTLQVLGDGRYEAFDVFLPLLHPKTDAVYTLDVRSIRDGRERRLRVAAMTPDERVAFLRSDGASGGTAAWTTTRRDGLVLLRMPTWAMYNGDWDWRAFLARTFDALAKEPPSALVIDLRGNEGGDSVGDVLIAHLIDAPLRLPQYRRLVRYRRVPESLAPVLDTWDDSFRDWGDDVTRHDDRYYTLHRFDDDAQGNAIAPVAPRFPGRVFVLTDAGNSSATFEFATQVKDAKLATLVGETTGGNQRGINGGAFFFLRLPDSRIELDLPLVGQFPVTPKPDAGVAPDLAVAYTARDLASGRDPWLDAVRAALAAPPAHR